MIARNITCISPNGIGAKEPHFAEMKKAKLVSILEDLSTDDLVAVHNRYCELNRYYDDIVHRMDELEDALLGIDKIHLLEMVEGNDFSTNDPYFMMDYDNIKSLEEWDVPDEIEISSLADWILRTGDGCGVDPVEEFTIWGLGG